MLLQYEAFPAALQEPLRLHYAERKPLTRPVWKLWHPVLWRDFRVLLAGRTADQVMAGFNQATRRKIRKAQKSGVAVERLNDPAQLQEVHSIWEEDAQRQGYVPRTLRQIRELYDESTARGVGEVLLARVGDEIAAFNFVLHYGIATYYLHGGYREKHSDACANHLLQFEAMQRAMARGSTYYSLAAPGRGGLLQYKQGFGGEIADNTRFVTVPLKRAWTKLLGPVMGQVKLMNIAKKWAAGR